MIFKDRIEAAKLLLETVKKIPLVRKNLQNIVIISLLRGGAPIGAYLAEKLKCPHLPLVVSKIPAPENEELALGALVFDIPYLDKEIVQSLRLEKSEITKQIVIAYEKFNSYLKRFGIKKGSYQKLKGKVIVLVDDGVATGASVKAALLFLKGCSPSAIILAIPVAPLDFSVPGFDHMVVLHRDPMFGSVSQFYEDFPQVEDNKVRKLLNG